MLLTQKTARSKHLQQQLDNVDKPNNQNRRTHMLVLFLNQNSKINIFQNKDRIIIITHQYVSNQQKPQNQNRPHTSPIIKNNSNNQYTKQTIDTRHKTRHDHINEVQIPKTPFSPTSKILSHPPNIKPIT